VLGNEHAGFGGRPRGKGPAHAGTSPRGRPTLDCLNLSLQWRKVAPVGKTPETGARVLHRYCSSADAPPGMGRYLTKVFKETNEAPKSRCQYVRDEREITCRARALSVTEAP
jgi:hypothetical protein